MPPHLDHLVVAIRSLDEGIAQFAAMTGVTPAVGGKHPGRGTENALVSLGAGSYLEILAPQKGARLSARDEPLRGVERLTVVDWAVRVPHVDAAVAALQEAGFATSPPRPGARLTPAGERLDWMTFGFADGRLAGAPFFIRWSPNTRHPSTTAPFGCALQSLTIDSPSSDRIAAALAALGVSSIAVRTAAPRAEAVITCEGRTATLSSR